MAELTNDDVTWTADFDGYTPRLNARAQSADPPRDALLDMLDDPRAFVVAHVLLTLRSGQPYSTAPTWNGLAIGMAADGTVTIDADQRSDLARRWRADRP